MNEALGAAVAVDENVVATLATVLIVGGMALIGYAAYRQYVVLPEERDRNHVTMRVALAVVGVVLVLLGTGLLS